MPFTGKVYATGFAAQADCPSIPYRILEPDRGKENLALLARAIGKWTATSQDFVALVGSHDLTVDVAQHAGFGVDVLKVVRGNLELGVCCILLAVDPDDDVLGALTYFLLKDQGGSIGLLAVDPRNMPGSPFVVQLRGVGTALIAAAAKRVLAAGLDTIYLHPLDEQARRFWAARGFGPCGLGGLMCVRGTDALTALVGGCLSSPEAPLSGEYLLCGLPRSVREKLTRPGSPASRRSSRSPTPSPR